MKKKRFDIWECGNCNASITARMDLDLFSGDLEEILTCCKSPKMVSPHINVNDTIWLMSEGDGYYIRNHVKSFTYKPKIKAVMDSLIKQTIRPMGDTPVMVGDSILFHGWVGRPYHSDWSWRFRVRVTNIHNIQMFEDGIFWGCVFFKWSSLDQLAKDDGIVKLEGHGYGESMGIYFKNSYKKELKQKDGKTMQIIQWDEVDIIEKGDV